MADRQNNAIMETDSEYAERVSKLADNMFTIDEILEVWYSVYGKDMAEPKFIDELRQRIA